jgi:hypothetical protein
MCWFRSNIRLGARFALFALALQVVLSFGHVHIYGIASQSATPVLSAYVSQDGAGLPNPSDPRSADFDCPICALIQLAATSTPSVPPELPVPVMVGLFRLEAPADLSSAASPYVHFQARAPPTV